ncbi:MAG: histidine phosphatase family protein [Gammaproteobacteria bacterium]|nr:histidine phosphatase family protein [Gammaproteobacteria bacterium]
MSRVARLQALASVVLAVTLIGGCSTLPATTTTGNTGMPALILIVRHAEKAAEPSDDPPLTAAGVERAQALAAALRDAGVNAIFTTQLIRTRDTAQPFAAARGLTPEVIPSKRGEAKAHAEAVAAAARKHAGEIVLIVDHSNTIPAVIAALGGPQVANICEPVYGNLFVLVPGTGETRLVRSHYGAGDPEPGQDCK